METLTKNGAAEISAETRVLLWDIDGTLMTSVRGGAYKRYFIPALEKVYGTSGNLSEMTVSGMTDVQIAFEALRDKGFTLADIESKLPVLLEIFPTEMRRVLDGEQSHVLLDGIAELLAQTAQNPRYINALLTGNLTPAARIKLEKVGIENYFDFDISAFGELSHERSKLGFAAAERARRKFGCNIQPSQFIIIGDTPNDAACARSIGAKVILVGTGRGMIYEELEKLAPDAIFRDFSAPQEVLKTLAAM